MSTRRSRHHSKPQQKADEALYLREHVYVIQTAEQYFEVQRRIRHARYAIDSILAGGRLYGSTDQVEPLFETIRQLKPRFDELEPKATPPQKTGGQLVRRDDPPLDDEQFRELAEKQIGLWQEAEQVLARLYESMAGSLEGQVMSADGKRPELLPIIALLRFHTSKRMDQTPPLRTYTFALGSDEPFDVSFEDFEPRRRRAELWYDTVLETMARVIDAQRRQKESDTLIRLTWVITILTIIVAILTGVTLWASLFR